MDSNHWSPVKRDGVFRDHLIDLRPLLLPENQATPSRGGLGVRILPSTSESISVVECDLYGSNLAPLVL